MKQLPMQSLGIKNAASICANSCQTFCICQIFICISLMMCISICFTIYICIWQSDLGGAKKLGASAQTAVKHFVFFVIYNCISLMIFISICFTIYFCICIWQSKVGGAKKLRASAQTAVKVTATNKSWETNEHNIYLYLFWDLSFSTSFVCIFDNVTIGFHELSRNKRLIVCI